MRGNGSAELRALVARQRAGFTLERDFYVDEAIFGVDLEHLILPQWLFVDHVSRLPERGDYLLYEIAAESIIVVRGEDEEIHAHFNVCRHRGSRVCVEPSGNASRLTCPYHAWSYGLDGRLQHARDMPPEFDRGAYGLHPCRVRVFEGLIYVNPSETPTTPDHEAVSAKIARYLAPHGLERAKIAHREVYPTNANWKLVVENFRECYHCAPAHPEYTEVNAYVRAGAIDAYRAGIGEWERKTRDMGHVVGMDRWTEQASGQALVAWRQPIREG